MSTLPRIEVPPGPAPVVHPDNRAFWRAVSDGEFRLQRCAECATVRYPVAPVCHRCLSAQWQLVEVDTHATVAAAITVTRATGGGDWGAAVPYRAGLVDLPVGVRLPGRLICDCGQVEQPGTPVRMATTGTLDPEVSVWVFVHDCGKGEAG